MTKQIHYLLVAIALTSTFNTASAEDVYIDCTNPNINQDKCAALYHQQVINTPAPLQQKNLKPDEAVINATPEMNEQTLENAPVQQIIMRDTAAPIAISQPMNELEEVGSEYAFYKTQTGGLVVERDVTQEVGEDGTTIQTTRTTETTVTPSYVEMPSISAHRRSDKIAYGETAQDWEALNGDSLRNLLIDWGKKSGWTVVWKLDRDYILEAGVVFRGTFTEVSSAIIRTFARANPAPIGTFYKGNRVLVINTQEDDNG